MVKAWRHALIGCLRLNVEWLDDVGDRYICLSGVFQFRLYLNYTDLEIALEGAFDRCLGVGAATF